MSQATLSPGPYRNSNLFSGRYLDEHVYELDAWDCDTEAREAFEAISNLYETRKDALSSYDEPPLRNKWIDKVLEELGHETLEETPLIDAHGSIDRTLYETEHDQMNAAVMKNDGKHARMYGQSLSILEAKQWDADFTQRFSEQRSYRDASHQIKSYLEHTPESVSWGILTNGKKWRLYGTKDYETETYYEVDLPDLLASGSVEVFKYFYVFFRPTAFRESAGTTFLDTVWSESEIAAQELGEDLQDNVFTALRVLGEGFVMTNDLEIDPTENERLAELKEQSLVLLYRLMFVLYAESRDLIDPEGPSRRSEYEENFSLGVLRHDIREEVGERPDESAFEREFSEYSFSIWNRLERLFSLVDTGNNDLGIPPYNGGLFDEEQHEFLTEYEVANTYLAEVIYRLSTTETDEGFVPADYADLDTRHLGTIYEGLLEHEFAVAPEAQAAVAENGGEVWKSAEEVSVAKAVETVEKGELYVVNDDGERKATGAYYTPDYVVTYIVEETVGPLLSDIKADLAEMDMEPGTQEYVVAFWEHVTDLKILDPAMGSGHFLTKATGYLADAVMEQVRELETATLFNEVQVKREISRECIYGVDVNGMAVELAKLSMWLETLAVNQPLAFLDHHLKTGNSLVGSDITEVLSNDETDVVSGDEENGTIQPTLDHFNQVRRRVLEHVMDLMGELLAIENETLEDVHSMEEIYAKIRADPLYGRLRSMATVHTASQLELNVPNDADKRMAEAIEAEDDWATIVNADWFNMAQAMSDEKRFFHWELEFPEVFFDIGGERMDEAGFDAVVGNPPYGDILSVAYKRYCRSVNRGFDSERADVFTAFVARAREIVRPEKITGYILPNTFLRGDQYSDFREINSQRMYVESIIDYNDIYVFNVEFYTAIVLFKNIKLEGAYTTTYVTGSEYNVGVSPVPFEIESGTDNQWIPRNPLASSIRHSDLTTKLDNGICRCHDAGIDYKVRGQGWQNRGEGTSVSDLILYEGEKRYSEDKQYIGGSEITPFYISPEQKWLRHDYESFIEGDIVIQVYPKYSESPEKIVTRQTAHRQDSIIAAVDQSQLYTAKSVHTTILHDNDYDIWYITAILNSRVIDYIYDSASGEQGQTFGQVTLHELRNLPIPKIEFKTSKSKREAAVAEAFAACEKKATVLDLVNMHLTTSPKRGDVVHDLLARFAREMTTLHEERERLNLNLLDYVGNYADGPTLGDLYQPPRGLSSSVLVETAASSEFEKLRATEAQVERDGGTVRVFAVPYVKPDGAAQGEYETLDSVLAMEFFDLSDAQADLIEAFVPYAVKKAKGFAGYRDDATKTYTLLKRLEDLTLPALSDVGNGIERYIDRKERAAELDAKIERTNKLIDEIVYELYGLTDEEIEIVEKAVSD